MCDDQRRFVQCLDDIRHCKSLTRTGDTEQCLELIALPLLPRRVQHILNKNPVPRSRIVHQHMGHSAYQLAVLNNRASAHG